MRAHLRIARPTRDLERLVAMYREGLELELLGSFRDHQGFDGAMLGAPGAEHHLELTCARERTIAPSPTPEDLLVFYVPEPERWAAACERMERAGFARAEAHNPYWELRGRTYVDPDGYRVVIQRAAWPE